MRTHALDFEHRVFQNRDGVATLMWQHSLAMHPRIDLDMDARIASFFRQHLQLIERDDSKRNIAQLIARDRRRTRIADDEERHCDSASTKHLYFIERVD